MSKIALFFYCPIIYKNIYQVLCFYEGLSKALEEKGNQVLQCVTNDFLITPWNGENLPITNRHEDYALSKIIAFKPDLVISFNNSKIRMIEKRLNCPIVLWDADDFLYFNDKKEIIKNIDRYLFFAFFEQSKKNLQKNLSISNNSVAVVKPATHVQNKKEVKKYPVSFIGTPFFSSYNFLNFYRSHHKMILDKTSNVYNQKYLTEYGLTLADILFRDSGSKRFQLVISLLKQDLYLFGPSSWTYMAPMFYDIERLYQSDVVFSLTHNEKIYNRSCISLNICHTQNTDGYPWRVPDILASDSVLLSDNKRELLEDFKHINKLQIYNNDVDASKKVRILLQDNLMRQDLVAQQNALVEEKFRWKHRFPIMEQLTGVSLASKKQGTIERLFPPHSIFDDFLYKTFYLHYYSKVPRQKARSHLRSFFSRIYNARKKALDSINNNKQEYK